MKIRQFDSLHSSIHLLGKLSVFVAMDQFHSYNKLLLRHWFFSQTISTRSWQEALFILLQSRAARVTSKQFVVQNATCSQWQLRRSVLQFLLYSLNCFCAHYNIQLSYRMFARLVVYISRAQINSLFADLTLQHYISFYLPYRFRYNYTNLLKCISMKH